MKEQKLMNIYELEDFIAKRGSQGLKGLLFCFGTSFISKIIKAKTRLNVNEIVPSHVALIAGNHIYESTTSEAKIHHKNIKQGVRRWLLKDFIEVEKEKLTKYLYLEHEFDVSLADKYVHLPYGKDTILDFLLKDGSAGDSKGLICSQFANMCIFKPLNIKCPTPADLLRAELKNIKMKIIE